MRLDQMPYHSVPTVAVLPFREFKIGWTWQLRALKLFPDSQLSWKRHFVDNGKGHARGTALTTYAEAMAAADEFNEDFHERVGQAVSSSELQASTILKVEKALTSGRRIRDEEELMEREAFRRNVHFPRPAAEDLQLPRGIEPLREALSKELQNAPYLQLAAFPDFNACLRRTGDLTWE